MRITLNANQMEEVEGLGTAYPYAYHHVDLSKTMIPWHWHEALEFNYVLHGCMEVSSTSRTERFQQGEGFFINRNVLTAMENRQDCILASHLFHPVLLSGHFKSVYETKYLEPVTQNRQIEMIPIRGIHPGEEALLHRLQQLTTLQLQPNSEFQTRNLLSEIWLLLLEILPHHKPVGTVPQLRQQRLQTMLSFLHSNYADKLTLEQIAETAAISTRECLRCFQEGLHCSAMDYLAQYRIRMAKRLLESTQLSIAQIAGDTGFSSCAYFGKLFKRVTGVTPSEYRSAKQG